MRSFLALAALALLFVGCTPDPADAQLLGRLLCRQQQPQTVVMYARGQCAHQNNHNGNNNDLLNAVRLNYYWEHLATLRDISDNTAGINEELGRMNQNMTAAMMGIRQAIVDQTELSLIEPQAAPLPSSTMVIPAPQPMPAARTASNTRFARHSGIVSYYLR